MRIRAAAKISAFLAISSGFALATSCTYVVADLASSALDSDAADAPSTETSDVVQNETSVLGCPADMVRATSSCIDKREVSAAEYYAFARVADAAGRKATTPRCGWVGTWQPATAFGRPVPDDDRPAVAVNWCQAAEYCASVGKRLCGKVGGGTLSSSDRSRPGLDEWYTACSDNAKNDYCYGKTFDSDACNVATANVSSQDTREPVGSRATCQGGASGLRDMSGNAAEWFDACDTNDTDAGGFLDNCPIHTGSIISLSGLGPEEESKCLRLDGLGRGGENFYIGFRCCATPSL